MRLYHIIILFIPALLVLNGCVQEDNRYCEQGLYVLLEPNNPKHNIPGELLREDVYVYDTVGNLVTHRTYTPTDLRSGDHAALVPGLDFGEYTVITTVNGTENIYETLGTEKLSTIMTALKSETVNTELTPLFSGMKKIIFRERSQEETVNMAKHTHDITLEVRFNGYELPDDMTIETSLSGNNGAFYHQAYISPTGWFRTYMPYFTQNDPAVVPMVFGISTKRIWLGSDMTLVVNEVTDTRATGRTLTFNLAAELAKVQDDNGNYLYDTDAKLEYYDEYAIVLTLGPDMTVLSMTINDWSIIGGGVEV